MKIKIVFSGGSWVTVVDEVQLLHGVVEMVESGEITGWEYL